MFAEAIERGRGGCLVLERRAGSAPVHLPDTLRTIRVRAAPGERLLAYAALTQLCEPFLPLLEDLPPVQARALEGALALGPAEGDSLAVAAGFRSLLLVAAERAPLLLVVEEAHQLDRGSASVLGYAARRLEGASVGVVITQDPQHPGCLELPGVERRAVSGSGPVSPTTSGATDLDDALERAQVRGSVADVAAAFEERAGRATGARRVDALLDAGQAWLDAGEVAQASAAARAALDEAGTAQQAGRAELLLGRIEAGLGNGRSSATHLRAAADRARAEAPDVAACALLLLVPPAVFAGRLHDAASALEEACRLLDAADAPEDDPLRRLAAAVESAVAMAAGRSTDATAILALAADAADAPATAAEISLLVTMVALPLIWVERYDVAHPLLRGLIATLRAHGAIGALPMPLCALSVGERRYGRLTQSLILASEAKELAEQTGNRGARLFALAELANAHSLFGDAERTRAAAEEVLRDAGRGAYRTSALSALATLELWTGDPAIAIKLLEPVTTDGDLLSPSVTLFHQTLITAYAAVGRTDDALPLLEALEAAAPATDGRLRATLARCRALLAPEHERDARFAAAVEQAGSHRLTRALTRLLYARRLLADGATAEAAALFHELAAETDENLLGTARAARYNLTRLGLAASGADPAWALLGPSELEVALAAVDRTPLLALADRLRLSPPEVERLRDDLLVTVGARSGPEVAAGLQRPTPSSADAGPAEAPGVEIRLLGGLQVRIDGVRAALPAGAASTTLGLLALRRAVHVEELTDVLWPDAVPEVARRRLRNVLARLRQAVGPIVTRTGERLELAAEVVVDHHVLETRARRALALPPGPARRAAIAGVLEEHDAPLLPDLLYEEWTQAARHRSDVRREELLEALADDALEA